MGGAAGGAGGRGRRPRRQGLLRHQRRHRLRGHRRLVRAAAIPRLREAAMASREALGGYLADRRWMARVLDETYAQHERLADVGATRSRVDDGGGRTGAALQGPEYMRRMRSMVQTAGVSILDHSPAVELLVDDDGAVAGATGIRRHDGRAVDGAGRRGHPRHRRLRIPKQGARLQRAHRRRHCWRPRRARSCPAWSSPTPTRSRPEFTSRDEDRLLPCATFYHEDGTRDRRGRRAPGAAR